MCSLGGLPTFWGGDPHQKTSIEPLKGIDLGVAQDDLKPFEDVPQGLEGCFRDPGYH